MIDAPSYFSMTCMTMDISSVCVVDLPDGLLCIVLVSTTLLLVSIVALITSWLLRRSLFRDSIQESKGRDMRDSRPIADIDESPPSLPDR
ncbi:hypothetical protein GCK32_019365 [Trichostrongylus colubriformis]|uniref:Uncharacterized protein n=1 Tax=Trichostrongylus colubriformis TaxID=6319 RepID=A0AAN8FWA2_TRICO